jgi:hypothetical protein
MDARDDLVAERGHASLAVCTCVVCPHVTTIDTGGVAVSSISHLVMNDRTEDACRTPRLCLTCNADLPSGSISSRRNCDECIRRRRNRRKAERDKERRAEVGLSHSQWARERMAGKCRCTRCRKTLPTDDTREVTCSTGAMVRVCQRCADSRAPCPECADLCDRRARPVCPACGEPYRDREPEELRADRGLGCWAGRAMP